jgi:hypothetical protein
LNLTQKNLPANAEQAPVFARHESFHPRHGWLRKGHDRFSDLSGPDAPVRLGVGKNMVSAIRYWSLAFKILEEAVDKCAERNGLSRSAFGDMVFGETGLDPYLESPATYWLLHWQLLRRPCLATTWHFTFFKFNRSEFTAKELTDALMAYKCTYSPEGVLTRPQT